MQVYSKLDTCGIKLNLSQWYQFKVEERQLLVEMPCEKVEDGIAYEKQVQQFVWQHKGIEASEFTVVENPD